MNLVTLSLGVALFGSLRVCGSSDASPSGAASTGVVASASGNAEASVKLAGVLPRIGGSMVLLENHAVELKLNQSGSIEALVSNAVGELVSDGAQLSVSAQAEGGAREETKLAFSKPHGRFEGRCKGKLAPGPVDVSLDLDGKVEAGKLPNAVIARGPELGGALVVSGAHAAEVFVRPSGEVLAFVRDRAGAEVKGDAGLDVRARLRTTAGATEDVALAFEAPRGCFAGRAKAGVELAPGPLELGISAKGVAQLGRLEKLALLVEASHGGEVLVAGDYSAEIVVQGKALSAFVADASGKASADADLDVKVELGADAGTTVRLGWDPKGLCYRGTLSAEAGVDLKPIRVEIAAAGKAFMATALSLRAVGDARLKAAAKLDGKAELGAGAKVDVNVPELKGNVSTSKSASAKVSVAAPKVTVEKKASAGAKAGGKAKASAGIHLGVK